MLKYLSFLALLGPVSAHANALPEAPSPDAATVQDHSAAIIVAATRLATPVDRLAASATVLDKRAIDASQDIGVSELLLRTPGVTMSRNGGYGTSTSLRIRGAEAEQIAVVVDGVKLNDPSATSGGYNFANLLVGDASRIEVLRGPQSIVWGSQAIGGVVNIVTPLPESALEASIDVEAGSRETVSARAAIGGRAGPLAWRLGGQSFSTAGVSAIAPAFNGREKDGYANRGVSGRALLELARGVSAELRGYYSSARTEIDATTGDSPEFSLNREFAGYAGFNVDLMDGRFRNRFGYAYTDTSRDNFNPARARQQTFDAAGVNRRIEYQGSFAIAEGWTLAVGAENERSRFRSVSPPAALTTPVPAPVRGEVEITGVYGQVVASPVGGLTLNAGLRHDDHDRFGGRTLFGAGAVWLLPGGIVLRASYGDGFKAPTLFQMFSEYGNAGLHPERARGWEAGAEQRLLDGTLRFGATYFERTTRDQIIFNSCAAQTDSAQCLVPGSSDVRRAGYYANVARAIAHGIEAQAVLKLGGFSLDGNYSWTVAVDRSPGAATFGNWLPRRPRDAANLMVSYAWASGLTTGAAVRWSGKTWDNAANTTLLGAYTLVDLRAEYAVSPAFSLFGRIENLLDEQYMTAFRYNTLGRGFYAGVRARL